MRDSTLRFGLFGLVALLAGQVANAQESRETLGVARIFTNDVLASMDDRWRSGGVDLRWYRGREWTGQLPTRPFELLEFRFRGEAITPEILTRPVAGDRPYAGTFYFGVQTHFDWRGFDVAAGADIAITGNQTGIRDLHSDIHDLFGYDLIDPAIPEVDDGIYLNATLEIARSLRWDRGEVRPFVEVQAGVENLIRAGVDFTIGTLGRGGLMSRDPVTGHRIAGINGIADEGGWSFLLGADTAYVESSIFLPEDRGFEAEENRHRVRAGVNYGFGQSNIFYGVAWLSEEFVGQPEAQMSGVISVDLRF